MPAQRLPLRMSEQEFRLLREAIQKYCGIFFDDHLKYVLERRLAGRVERRMLRNFAEYEQFLRYDPARAEEFSEIVELLTTNETYFFREGYQLTAFVEEVLPEILRRKREQGDRTLRVWSAGCSTGEEPYTLAILMAQQGALAGWEWEVFASDISKSALQRARAGVYRSHSFRVGIPPGNERYFKENPDGTKQIKDDIRKHVTFAALNLVEPDRMALVRHLDAIFCRNVIIYFDQDTKKQVIGTFYEKLEPGGFLFLGHSESLINLSTQFELRHFKNDMIYQRPLPAKGGAA